MPVFVWKESYNLGIEQIDTSHRHLVQMLNTAYDSFIHDSNVEALSSNLNEFFDYTLHHFSVEEQYMEDINYTGYVEHLELHKNFSAQVTVMRKDLRAVWGNLPLEMISFLNNWLTYEILVADADYVRVNSRNQWQQCA
jgi:hemerythrin